MKKFTPVLLTSLIVLSLSSCGSKPADNAPPADPQSVIREMIGNSDMTKLDMRKGKIAGAIDVAVNTSEKVAFNLRAEVDSLFDLTNLQQIVFDLGLKLSGKGAIEGQNIEGLVSAQLTMLEKKLYISLKELDLKNDSEKDKENVEMLLSMVKPYLNKWYYTEVPSDLKMDYQTLTDDQKKKVTTIIQDANLFTVTKDNGVKDGAYNYDVDLNMANVVDMAAKLSKELASEKAPSDTEIAKAKEDVANLTVKGNLAISTDSKKLRFLHLDFADKTKTDDVNFSVEVKTSDDKQFQGYFEVKNIEKKPENNVKITFDLTVDKSAPVSITAPADATSIAEMFGSMTPTTPALDETTEPTPLDDTVAPTADSNSLNAVVE